MIKERIEQYLTTQFSERIINTQDFFFQKGQDALQKWMNLSINNEDKADLEKLAGDYEGLQTLASQKHTINVILNLLFEIISYCDSKAKSKDYFNQYDDNRTLAMAYVRMNHWIEKLIMFKFNPDNVPVGSIRNAINYLLDPNNNATILSENHRIMISKTLFKKEYNPGNFIKDLEEYFSSYQIKVSNSKNYTYLLSCIIYFIKKEWLDDIIGLMASDNTEWKDNTIDKMQGSDCTILWNSKRPTGTDNTLKMLRSKINDGGYFKLFYSVHGNVQYVAEIIDFVENDSQLKEKNWPSKFKKIDGYENDFSKYNDDNKSANIVFLTRKFEKIQSIPAASFITYKGWAYPVQDNLTPIISEPDIIAIPTNNNSATSSIMNNNTKSPLNQILYGPPGTGKTYATKELAVKIANPDFVFDELWNDEKKREEIIKEYKILFESGQIVFTTFHQSMSYEDFVEGIKPKTINNQVEYEVEDGIFKQICQKASVKNGNFDEVIEKLKHDVSELDGKPALTIKYANNSFSLIYRGTSVFYVQPQNTTKDNPWYPVNINNMRIAFDTNDYERLYNPTYIREILNYLVKEYALVKGKKENSKNYVLIIDEINRGNVSAIFGELITLLETDKRIGEDEQIFLDLPYSKNEKFGIPNNLYLIGTMNTADRSVEALDTALRRRFSFTEVMPEPKLLEGKFIGGIALDKLLETINKRIEILLDRDHTIGHSYFIKLKEDYSEGLKQVFKNCIIPLLQEYFYGDYEKIGMIIGTGFFDETQKYDSKVFATFPTQNYPENGSLLSFKSIDEDFNIIDAIKILLKIKEEKKTDA
ncbi:McrB family protein [Flavobacterium sp. C3NV]|uniref:McrB family protein n=1 Tax=Flavobacterium sp. C3NV TaxID=3393358 RepID=UPI0039900D18